VTPSIRKMSSFRARTRVCHGFWMVAAVAAFAAGCDRPLPPPQPVDHPGDETPRRGGTLRLASFGDMRGLDPAVVSDALSLAATEILFAGLVDYDLQANVVPVLASRYEIAEGGLVYRFFLRENVLFHDGTELSADDVKRSIERALQPDTPNPFASSYEAILGYEAFTTKKADHLEGVLVEGRYVVSIRLKEADSRFLFALALPALRPVCKSAGDRYADGWALCGAGPFKLLPGGWDRGRSLTVVRHEGYFQTGRPYLDAVSWTFNVNRLSELYRFQDGDLDSTRDLGDAEVSGFLRDPLWKPYAAFEADRSVIGEFMNTEIPPFDNVEIRRAVAAGINREHYKLIKPVSISVATQAIPPAVPGYDPNFKGQTYDYAAALEHMKKAGYPYDPETGQGGYPSSIPYLTYPDSSGLFTGQILQQELARIGLRLELRLVNYPSFLALAYRRKASAMSAPGWQMDYPDPSSFFDQLFGSAGISDENSTNFGFYKNPRLDAIIDQARHELDNKVRYALYGEANRIVCDDAPEAFTNFFHFFVVSQPWVHDFGKHAVWSSYAVDAWIDHARKDDVKNAGAALGLKLLWPGATKTASR
jgi:ABC-type transport system substrate-binding protein